MLVPSGENATEIVSGSILLCALVFSATQLMSIAIILRRGVCIRQHMEIWGSRLEGRLNGLDADMQQPTACRKDEGDRVRRVRLRSSSRTESRMPSREAAQLKASGLGSHVAVKRAGMEGREAYWSALGGGARLRKGTRKNSL